MPWFRNGFPSCFFAVCLFFAGTGSVVAQLPLPVPRVRVVRAVDDSHLKALTGNTHPLARPEFDQGALGDAATLGHIVLVLQRGPEQEAALERLIDQQQDKSSPSYHQWLTPQSFGAAFGPSDGDLSAVTSWLAGHGFSNIHVNAARTFVEFDGTAGTVRAAFHTTMHRYRVQGAEHFANASDPEIPEALAPVIAGIASLNNFPRKAANHKVGNFRRDAQTNTITRLPEAAARLQAGTSSQPGYTFTSGSNTFYGLTPYDFATIYNVLPLWNASAPIDGTGETIAIAGQTDINAADFVNFRRLFNLPLGNTATPTGTQYLNIIYNGPNPGVNSDEGEADIDTQWTGAVAKGATIDYVVSEGTEVTQGTDLSAIYIVDNDLAPILSYSYGQCELFLGTAGNAFYNTLWQQAAAEGITVLLASGDSGSAGCDNSGANYAVGGLGVNGLGSTPYNVAVGGTDFYMPKGGTGYWSHTNSPSTEASALGYIPEAPWNESCTNPAFATTSVFYNETPDQVCNNVTTSSDGFLTVVGGGGGASNCTHSDGRSPGSCSGGYRKPAWQTGKGVPADGLRDVPDVSLFASAGFFGAFYIVCQQSGNPDGRPCSLSAPSYDFAGYGGTSVAAPGFAGMMALVDQKTGSRQGNANYVLYNLASRQVRSAMPCDAATGTPYSGCVFNDVTTGTIAMPCLRGSTNCVTSSTNRYGILSGWRGAAGYDLATGLGSVNAANLVNDWSNAAFAASSTTLVLAPANVVHGSPISATVNVSSTAGTPTGSVSINALAANGQVASGTLNNGVYTASVAGFPGGTYSVSAHYAGDGTYAASDSNPVSLTVTPEASTTGLQTLLYNFTTGTTTNVASQTYGSMMLLRADVAGLSGQGTATGDVTLTDNGVVLDGGMFRLNSNGYTEDQTTLLAPGTHVLRASYSGDNSFNPSQSPALRLVITKAPTATAILTSPSSVSASAVFQLTAKLSPGGGRLGLPPTGTLTVSADDAVLGTAAVAQQAGSVTITVSANQLDAGENQLTVSYSGDANYLGSTSLPVQIDVQGTTLAASATTLTVSPSTVAPGTTVLLTSVVTPGNVPIPTGIVSYLADGQPFGSTQVLAAGKSVEVVNVNGLAPGRHSITAVYSGDSQHQASISAPAVLTVSNSAIPSATSIAVSAATVEQGTTITITSTTTSSTSVTGSSGLLLDGNLYGQPVAMVNATATFSLTTSTLQPGSHTLQVRYLGDTAHLSSTSAVASLMVVAPVGSFSLSTSTPTVSVSTGAASGAITLTATPSGGFHSTITFACTGGLPAGETCLFTPPTLTLSGSSAETASLVIAPAASNIQSHSHASSSLFPAGSGIALAGLCLLFLPNRRRLGTLTLFLAFVVLGVISGCGSGGIAPVGSAPSSSPASGTYAVIVAATGGSTIQTATINLTLR